MQAVPLAVIGVELSGSRVAFQLDALDLMMDKKWVGVRYPSRRDVEINIGIDKNDVFVLCPL
jgi:hypothetical protein